MLLSFAFQNLAVVTSACSPLRLNRTSRSQSAGHLGQAGPQLRPRPFVGHMSAGCVFTRPVPGSRNSQDWLDTSSPLAGGGNTSHPSQDILKCSPKSIFDLFTVSQFLQIIQNHRIRIHQNQNQNHRIQNHTFLQNVLSLIEYFEIVTELFVTDNLKLPEIQRIYMYLILLFLFIKIHVHVYVQLSLGQPVEV